MKRYWIQEDTARETPDGEWVRWEEAHAIEQERDKLKAELAALKALPVVLSASEVTEAGHYWYWPATDETMVIVDIDYGDEGKLFLWIESEFTQQIPKGQFVGPIKMPEV